MATAELAMVRDESHDRGNDSRKRKFGNKAKIGSFVHGQLKMQKVDFEHFDIYQNSKAMDQQIMVAETANMTYVAKNFEDKLDKKDNLCLYLGVFDPETRKMDVMAVDQYKFKPYCAGTEDETTPNPLELSYVEQSDLLTSAFGSKRKRRAMEARKKNLVAEDTLKKVLDSTLKEGKDSAIQSQQRLDELMKAEDSIISILPPFDKEALKEADIFKFSDILGEVELETLTEPARELFDGTMESITQWREENKYSLTILKQLDSLPSSPEERWLQCKSLIYLHYLMAFFKTSAKHIVQRKYPFPEEWQSDLKNHLLKRFTGPPTSAPSSNIKQREFRSYTKQHQDRLLSYILIIGAIQFNFTLPLYDVVKDTKCAMKRIMSHARMIGFTVSNRDKPTVVAILKAPLNFEKKVPFGKKRN